MSHRRAEMRRAARADRGRRDAQLRAHARRRDIPVVPGVVPDGSVETLERALAEAHQDLPEVPGTRVEVLTWERSAGLRVVEEQFGADAALMLRERLDLAGPQALIAVAMRVPQEWHRHGPLLCDDRRCATGGGG